ncbi:MAG: radical SAM protein [DPANN group archaeon]|nr:radical SAM protein [DPANN group archaeon]
MQAYFDLPDRESSSQVKDRILRVSFAGCNFRCPSCNAPGLLEFKEDFLHDLKLMKQRIREEAPYIDGVIFTGGEPTLQRQALIELSNLCRKLRLSIGLDTNGSKPGVIRTLLEMKLVDHILLDIKAPRDEELFQKTTRSKTFFLITRQIIDDLRETLAVLKEHDTVELDVHTLIVPGLIYRKEDILAIASLVDGLDCRWSLVAFSNQNGQVLSKQFSNIRAPTEKFLFQIRDYVLKKHPNLRISIVTGD